MLQLRLTENFLLIFKEGENQRSREARLNSFQSEVREQTMVSSQN